MFQASHYGAPARPILPRLMPALLAFAATLLAGTVLLPFAGVAGWLESPVLLPAIGLALAAAAGLFACHLALLTIAPRISPWASALPAALVAGALPGLGAGALLVPLALVLICLPSVRLTASVGMFGVAIALAAAWLHSPAVHLAGSLILLAAATLQIRRIARPADNDNRRNEPLAVFWSLPDAPRHATQPARTSSPELGE